MHDEVQGHLGQDREGAEEVSLFDVPLEIFKEYMP
jgi:hypothetical protein